MARVPEIVRRNPLSQVAAQPAPAGQGFAALADIMGMAADFVKPAAEKQATLDGQSSVYRDENGQLQVEEKSVFSGEMGAIHNAAAFSKYLAQKGIDIEQTMAELATQYEYDPDGFKKAADGYVGILKEDENIPQILRDDLVGQVEKSSMRQFNGLYRGQVRREEAASNKATATRRDMLSKDYIDLVTAGDQEGADEVWSQIEEISRFRENAPFIMETGPEREAYLRGIRGSATAATLVRKLEDYKGADEISDEDKAELLGLVESSDLDPAQRAPLYAATKGRLKAIDAAGIVKGLTDSSFDSQVNRVLEQAAVGGAALRSDSFTGLDPEFAKNASQMVQDARAAGIELQITSAYRSPETQARIVSDNMAKHGFSADDRAAWEADVAELGAEAAGQKWRGQMQSAGLTKWVAMPGQSKHQSGEAIDFAVGGRLIRDPNSKAAKWIKANAPNYGLDVPMSWEPWEVRPGGLSAPSETDRLRNQQALVKAKIPATGGNEFLAAIMGADKAVAMLSADPAAEASDFLPDNVVEQFPALSGMTVRDAQNWAARKMTMKVTDLANQKVAINQIEDDETRALASRELADAIQSRQAIESAASNEFDERLHQSDPTLTEQEIMETHDLSNGDQSRLVRELRAANKRQEENTDFITRLAGGGINALDTGDKKLLNETQRNAIGDANPLDSDEGRAVSAALTKEAKFMPRDTFDALRTRVQSSDPAVVGDALEYLGQLDQLGDNVFTNYDGRGQLEGVLADYQFYSRFGSQEEAAAQIIKNREEKPKNITDQAKEVVKGLDISEVKRHFDDWVFSNPTIGVDEAKDITALSTPMQEEAMMADYSRLVKDAFMETADPELAKNRALKQMDRIYGVNMVSGKKRLMQYPPNGVYPAIGGTHEWLTRQLEGEVSRFVHGNEAEQLGGLINMGNPNEKWVDAGRIKLVSDDVTGQEVRAGQAPSYIVYYADDDGTLQRVPQRFEFDLQAAKDEDRRAFDDRRQGEMEREAVTQERISTQQELTRGILDRFEEPLRDRGFSPEDVVDVPSAADLESGLQGGTVDPTKPVMIGGMIYYPEVIQDGTRPK